jgi:hypothetical protein
MNFNEMSYNAFWISMKEKRPATSAEGMNISQQF